MICNVCFSMLRGQAGRKWRGSFDMSFDHQATLGSLKQSADMACCICRRVWEDMPVIDDRQKFSQYGKRAFVQAHITVLPKFDGIYRLDFTLAGALAAKYCIGTLLLRKSDKSEASVYTPQSRNLNSREVLNLARSWISKCIGPDHEHCPDIGFKNRLVRDETKTSDYEGEDFEEDIKPLARASRAITFYDVDPPFYPTRLIKLGSVKEDVVKLVITRNAAHRQDRNLKRPRGQYVTLSHCWGKTRNPFCLKSHNLNLFQESGIPLKELPRTFEQAINFARRLSPSNVKYIWIDSLCIMQDDPADWLYESTQMYQVYRNTYCNLSATAAQDSSRGLYAERDPQHLWAEDVNLNTEDMLTVRAGSKRKREPQGLQTLVQRCNIVDPSLWHRKVDNAPVNARAWVLQERLLAPRVLHFCEDQIAWECREMDASECAAEGIENFELKSGNIKERIRLKSLVVREYGPADPGLNSGTDIELEAHENWKRITERYSLTSLTKATDKLIALAGIAEQMSGQINAQYVAGMWRNQYFASQLLWRVETQYKNGRFLYPSRRPKDYRAPSFSWAAIDAPQGIRCGETQAEANLLIKILAVDVKPQSPPNSEFGLVKEGGFIDIECQRLAIAINRRSRRQAEGELDVYTWTLTGEREGDDERMHPNVYLDSPEDDFEGIHGWHNSMWLVPAHKNSSGDLIGLLLQRKNEDPPQYRRVGLSIIPRYVRAENAFLSEASLDKNGLFRNVRKHVIRVF